MLFCESSHFTLIGVQRVSGNCHLVLSHLLQVHYFSSEAIEILVCLVFEYVKLNKQDLSPGGVQYSVAKTGFE